MEQLPSSSTEIDFVDLFIGLWRQWRIMAAVFFLFLALSILAAVLVHPRYTYTAVFNVGGTIGNNGVQPFMAPAAVKTALEDGYFPSAFQRKRTSEDMGMPDFTVNILSGSNVLTVTVDGTKAGGTLIRSVIAAGLDKVLSENKRIFDAQKASIVSAYQLRIGTLKDRIKTLQATVGMKDIRASDRALITDQILALQNHVVDLQQQLQQALTALQPAQIMQATERSVKPTGISKTAVAVLGVVFAFFAAIIAGLTALFLGVVKQRMESSAAA